MQLLQLRWWCWRKRNAFEKGVLLMKIPEMIMPEKYELLKSVPEDPPYTRSFGFQTPGALCYVVTRPIPAGSAMPFDAPPVCD